MSRLPRQNDYRTFCMSDETEKVYQELEEVISVCWEWKGNKKDRINLKPPNYWTNTTFPCHIILSENRPRDIKNRKDSIC